MFGDFWQTITGWLPWAAFGGGIAGLAAYFLGLTPLLAALGQIASVLLDALLKALGWIWANVIWPGLRDILDNLATIVTVVILVGSFYIGGKLSDDVKYANLQAQHKSCMVDLVKAKKKASPVIQQPVTLPWPFG